MRSSAEKVLVVLSGGQDSTTCLFMARELGMEVHAVTINYGQRHDVEIEAARIVGLLAGISSHEFIDVGPILRSTSPLVDSRIELEQYESHAVLPGGIEKTFVPMRNQLFLTLAANRAVALGCGLMVTGVCEEDFGGYPDCREVFIDALQTATQLGLEGTTPATLQILAPLMHKTKRESVHMALRLPGCYGALAFSHTSYDGAYPPTGHDHATLLRAKGFEQADVPDPLILRAWLEGRMDLPTSKNYGSDLIGDYADRVQTACENLEELLAIRRNSESVRDRVVG